MQVIDDPLGRRPEGEGDDGHGPLAHELQLVGEGVVVEPRLAQPHAGALRVGRQALRVGLHPGRVGGMASAHEQVDAERPVGEAEQGLDVLGQPLRREVAGGEKARPPPRLTAAASAGVDGPPAIGAWTTGIASSSRIVLMTGMMAPRPPPVHVCVRHADRPRQPDPGRGGAKPRPGSEALAHVGGERDQQLQRTPR